MNMRTLKRQREREEAKATPQQPEILGLKDPKMTPQLAAELLKDSGVIIPFPLLQRIGPLCDPLAYRGIPNGELMDIADQLNGLLDKALRAAQAQPSEGPSKGSPNVS